MTEIRLATRADLPSVARLFGRAFIDDAMLRWPFPPETTAEDLTELFAILLDVYWPLEAISVIGSEAAAAREIRCSRPHAHDGRDAPAAGRPGHRDPPPAVRAHVAPRARLPESVLVHVGAPR